VAGNAVVLDSSALSALAEGDHALLVALRKELTLGATVVVPTVVISESLTGDGKRDANVNRALKATIVAGQDEGIARDAAALRYRNRLRGAGTIDAIVVATADRLPGTRILTGDARDLRPLANLAGRSVVIGLVH
jgi:predicted nucleic acid-binding protein